MTARRTCEQCGSLMPAYVPRRTLGGRKVCEGCATWHAKTALTKVAMLPNPIHKKTGQDEHDWYHGSKHEFHEFGDPEEHSGLAYESNPEDTSHWNTLLGNHFTSDHQVAADFANGQHSSGANSSGSRSGRVIHTKLHLKNPKVYASEHDMDQEVHEFEHAQGNTIDSHFPPLDDDADDWDKEDHLAEMGQAQHYAGDTDKPFGRHDPDPGQAYGSVHPKAVGWLNSHPDKYNIAARFKERLKDAGHDGIVYGNEYETSRHGKQASSAIAFHPHQIEITQDHTVNKNCLKPGEGGRRPGPGQEMLPGTEDLPSKRPYMPPPGDWEHPKTWHDPKMWREGKLTPHGVDWGRLTAPLPQECWDRYHGGHTAKFAGHKMKYTRMTRDGYEDVEKEVEGPLYHGGRANLGPGDLITRGRKPNSWGDEGPKSTHVYFSQDKDTAASYSQQLGNKGHLYEVEPTGEFKPDYGSQDYKTPHPLKVIRKVPREEWQLGSKTAAEYGDPTDWDKHYDPSTEIHRGMFTKIPFGLYEKLHGSVPKEEAATALMGHTGKRKNAGMHWSADLDQARDFGSPRTTMGLQVPVVLHGQVPAREAIETRPAMLRRNEVFPHDHREKEIPLRKGSDVDVYGISWKPEKPHPDADESGWVRHDFTSPTTHTAAHGEQSALNHAGQQDVYPVSTSRGVTPLCQYHLNVHQSIAEGANGLAGHLGIPQASVEPLGEAEKGKCADCFKNTDYQLKLNRPGGYDRQQSRDSQQPRTRVSGPYVPARTKALTPLRQSENARSSVSGSSNNGIRRSSSEDTTDSVVIMGSNRRAPAPALDHLRASTFSQVRRLVSSDKSKRSVYYYHGTADDPEYRPEHGDHLLRPHKGAVHLHPDEDVAWKHALKHWQDDESTQFPRVYRVTRNDIPAEAEETSGGGLKATVPVSGHETTHHHWKHPEIKLEDERGPIMYHGTAHDDDDIGLEHIHPANSGGSGSAFGPGTSDPSYAYATPNLHDAWDYAEKRRDMSGGTPRVYRVTPHKPEDVEEDPMHTAGGDSRGNHVDDKRSKSGFKVLDQVPMSPRQQHEHEESQREDDDDDWGDSHYGVKTADRQLSLFPSPPRVPKNPRKPKAAPKEKPAAPTLPPVEEREPLRNQYTMHRRSHTERDHWFHGGMHDLDLSRQTGEIGKTSHWNTGLGPHFAGNEKLAGVFATADEEKGESGPGRITHAKLHIANPKHYKNEYEMDHEVLKDEVARGTFDKDDSAVKGDLALKRSPFAMARLSSHPDVQGIAQRFKQKLIDQGHDGITYKNSIETGQGLCAVPFHHDQVKIAQSHDFDPKQKRKSVGNPYQCERPERTAMKKLPTLQMVAHDATENQELRHCPFCGGGKIIGRADGTVECQFCHQYFTVQVQPQFPNFPQTVDGMPQQIPGMPGQVDTPPGATVPGAGFPPGEEGAEDPAEGGNPFADGDADDAGGPPDGDADDSGGEEPPPFAKKSFKTVTGALLDEDAYARHLAIRFAPDRDAMIALVRQEQGAR